MSNKLIGVIEDNNLNVNVQITGSGPRGLPGKDGYTPIKGIDYFDGKDGKDGKDGYTPIKGIDYFDGYTPVKSVDYMTEEDINEIKEGLELDVEIEAATIEEIQRLF